MKCTKCEAVISYHRSRRYLGLDSKPICQTCAFKEQVKDLDKYIDIELERIKNERNTVNDNGPSTKK